jgi:hypothetical protein
VLGDFQVTPVAIHALGSDNHHGVYRSTVIQHTEIVDDHKALACPHVGKQPNIYPVPETGKERLLVLKRLITIRISR